MSTEDQEVGQWPSFEVTENVRDAILQLAQITPAVRYPSDDQTPVTSADAKQYAEAAHEVYHWAIAAFFYHSLSAVARRA